MERRELPSHTNIQLLLAESIFSELVQARSETCITEIINSERKYKVCC